MTYDWRNDQQTRDFVYFAHIGDYVKVGHSCSPERRLFEIIDRNGGGAATPRYLFPRIAPFHSLHAVPGGFAGEQQAHAAIEEYHEAGEWFIADPELLAWTRERDGKTWPVLDRPGGRWERPATPQELAEQEQLRAVLNGGIFAGRSEAVA